MLLSITISAQIEITGIVIEQESQEPLEYAEVVLLSEQSLYISGVITDENGVFELNATPGTYTVQITYIGAQPYSKKVIVSDEPINIGMIGIVNSQELDEIIIAGKRKLVQRKIDRLVFDVENSSNASQGNALEVLRATPGVRVQNDDIKMIGKNNLQVMVDNKIVDLSSEDLANFLKSIASEDIKNIEVITTPPAKYEAAGNSGLLNITLKEAKKDSWNARLNSSYLQRKEGTASLGGGFNFNKNKLSLATSFYVSEGEYNQEQDDYAHFPDGLWYTSSPFSTKVKRMNARADVNYQVTPAWSMGGQYLYNKADLDFTDAPYTPVFDYDTDEILRSLQSEGTTKLTPVIHSLNFNNEISLDTLGRMITLNLDYFTYDNPDTKTYIGNSIIENPFSEQFYRGINTNNQDVTNLSAKLDVDYPLDWVDLSFGGKITKSESLNDILFFNSGLVDNPVSDLPISQNDFEYKEDIQALYISASKNLNSKWSTQVGLRMEATKTDSKSKNLDLSIPNDYTKFFPTVYLSYNASESSNFSFNYSKRIQRPGFFELNPNIYFINPFQTIEGNAFLQPSFVDNYEITNVYKNFVTTLYYSKEDNLFAQVPLPNSNTNIIRFTNENYIDAQRFGFSENYTFDKISWWTSNNNLNVNYSISTFNLDEQQEDQKGVNATIATYNNFVLNEARTFRMGINYWYNFPGVDGIFNNESASSVSFYLQYLLLDNNLSITLRGNDLFKTSAERTTTTVNGVFQSARYYYDARSVQLSVSYKFGNKDIRAKRHATGNEDERGRTGN